MRGSTAVVASLVLAATVAGGVGLWWMVRSGEEPMCQACQRPVHVHSRTIGVMDGKTVRFCCPMCALTEHRQSGKQVKVTRLTDYESGAELDAGSAFLVSGSEINPCIDTKAHLSQDKQPLEVHFDRCSPSVLAFSDQRRAAAFARVHGGRLLRFAELEAYYR